MVNVNRCDDYESTIPKRSCQQHKEISQYTKTNVPVETPAKQVQDQEDKSTTSINKFTVV